MVGYKSRTVEHAYAMWQAYVNNLKHIYTSACGDLVDCIEFIRGIYTDIAVSHVHMK